MLIKLLHRRNSLDFAGGCPVAAPARALAPDGRGTYCVHDARFRYGSHRGTSVVGWLLFEKED